MKRLLALVLFLAVAATVARPQAEKIKGPDCSGSSEAVSRVHTLQDELKHIKVGEMDTAVPVAARNQLTQLKDALTNAADADLSCAGPSIDPVELQNKMAEVLHANPPEPPENSVVSKGDHRFDEALGSYGNNLRVRVRRPPNLAALLEVEFSVNIECGDDHMLLLYTLDGGAWRRQVRWQAPPLKEISDAFGDSFFSAILSAPEGGDSKPRVVVVHGTPWCSSRFSGFNIDILAPASDSQSPKLLWHTERSYSRGDFDSRLKSSGDTFELRVNDSTMDIDSYERHVIYRYRIDDRGAVQRMQPIATNARGFVEEWLSAPWVESKLFLARESDQALQAVHDRFEESAKPDTEFITHRYGPVRACNTPKIFQVQINSTLEKLIPGKPGGESKPLPTHYFHVRDIDNGYLMVSAPTEPDPTCKGPNLMPPTGD